MSTSGRVKKPVDHFGLLNRVLEGKFRVERLVAEGGFGVVYYGSHVVLGKPVAIKVLKVPMDLSEDAKKEFIEKFALEAKMMARISHPNIVQAFDFGATNMPSGDFAPWMVLEWIQGNSLDVELGARRGQGGRSPAEALELLRPAFQALAHAHEVGIAHRDIKPANIMVTKMGAGTTLRLMDFGIAKVMEEGESPVTGETRTMSTGRAFSARYAAPEQLSGTKTGPWTDVHALALIMTEVITDEYAYEAQDKTGLFGEVLSPQRPTPAKRRVDVGPWEHAFQRALSLNPTERFANAGQFLAALESTMPAGSVRMDNGRLSMTAPARPGGTSPPGAWTNAQGGPAQQGSMAQSWNSLQSRPGQPVAGPTGWAPPGTIPPGYVQPGTMPPGFVPQGAFPPGYVPQGPVPGAHTSTTLNGAVMDSQRHPFAPEPRSKAPMIIGILVGVIGIGVGGFGVLQMRASNSAHQDVPPAPKPAGVVATTPASAAQPMPQPAAQTTPVAAAPVAAAPVAAADASTAAATNATETTASEEPGGRRGRSRRTGGGAAAGSNSGASSQGAAAQPAASTRAPAEQGGGIDIE